MFIGVSIIRALRYATMPVHLRWELYPVAHESKRHYGGSYFENKEWWTKPQKKSFAGELQFMGKEILFFSLYYHRNRGYWYLVYPFHIGTYLIVGWLVLIFAGALTEFAGITVSATSPDAWGSFMFHVTRVVGVVGFLMVFIGSAGLLLKRSLDRNLRFYTTLTDYFNLSFILAIIISGLFAWYFHDIAFDTMRNFVEGLITFSPVKGINPATNVHIVLGCLFLVYMPFTGMMHFLAKFFTFHKVRWDDSANLIGSDVSQKVKKSLDQPVSWSASHVPAGKSWSEVVSQSGTTREVEKD
jgi:nitrate reductase gamma subunit